MRRYEPNENGRMTREPEGGWVMYDEAKPLTEKFKWRPIKELAEQHAHVLLLYEGDVYTGWLDDQSGEGWCTIIYGDQRVNDRVKYWMPKPALPEEKK